MPHLFVKNLGERFFHSVLAGSRGREELRLLRPARSASRRLSKSEKLSVVS